MYRVLHKKRNTARFEKNCYLCDSPYKTNNRSQKFCSNNCRDAYNIDDNGVLKGTYFVPKGLRFDVLRRDKFKCIYCSSKGPLEIDHLIPISAGGENIKSNLVASCPDCNRGKSDKMLNDQEIFLIKERISINKNSE